MCNFVSWIKKNGRIYCLTDAEVFSEVGREKLRGCKHNDFLGHGAIRLFWGLGNEGRDYEATDFWANKNIPKEIAKMIKNFDAHWGKIFRAGYFMNNDLCEIIKNKAPRKWKVKAWEQFFKQNPSSDNFYDIITGGVNVPKEWKIRAWEQFLKHGIATRDMVDIVGHTSSSRAMKAMACEEIFKRELTKENLRDIIILFSTPEKYREKAWKKLLEKRPQKSDFESIIWSSALARWRRRAEGEMAKRWLKEIIRNYK